MLIDLTKNYIESFNEKNMEGIEVLFCDDFILEDPVVKKVEGKEASLNAVKAIFDSCTNLSFEAKNIYQESQTTIIEFKLNIDGVVLDGVDIIEWEMGKMKELRAYLDIPCGEG